MLFKIPTLRQQNQVASKQFNKSTDILKKLDAKESKVGLNRQDVRDKKRHKQFIREYRIWKNKQGILPLSGAASGNKVASGTVARVGAATKKPETISTANKTPKQLQQLFQNNKKKLLEEVNRLPEAERLKRLATSGRKRLLQLKENVGIDDLEGRTLAKLSKERLEILFTLSAEYKKKTGKNINEEKVEEQKDGALKLRKLRATYRSAVKYLKKFEEHDLETLTGREKALLRICLRRKQRIDEEQGLPLATTRFDYLLTEAEEANESKEDSETVKENAETKDKTTEKKETADATKENEKKDDKKEDDIEDLTNEPEDQVENEEEKLDEQNVEDNEVITEEQTDKEENAEDKKEE